MIGKLINNLKTKKGSCDEIDCKLDSMIKATNELLEQYSGYYQPIAFESFDRMPLKEWVNLNEISRVMLLSRNEHEIKFVAEFLEGRLNYHNHPNAIEVFLLLDGEGELVVKDRYGKEEIRREKFEKGKYYTVGKGLHHKFIVNERAVTFGVLKKQN